MDINDAWSVGQTEMKKLCFVCPDDLSTLIFAKSFGAVLRGRSDFEFHTISKGTIFEKELQAIGSKHIYIKMERFIDPLADLRFFRDLTKIMKENKYDVVVTFTTKPNIFAALAAWVVGVPIIAIAVRGLGRVYAYSQAPKEKLLRIIVSTMLRFSFKVSNLAWFTNVEDMRFCVRNQMVPQHKAFLTRNAVNIREFSMDSVAHGKLDALRAEIGIAKSDNVVVMVARMIWSKGIREFAEASEILNEKFPHLKFLLVAPLEENSPHAVPLKFIKEVESRTNLIWLEFRKDIRDIYALADLAVLPSYYKEGGYPRALLEPMAMAKPVIGADTPDCRAPVEHGINGFLVPPRNSRMLAQRIEEIIVNEAMAKNFGRCSRQIVESKYDDNLVAREVLNHIFKAEL